METNKTNKGLLAVAAISVIAYFAIKNFYKLTEEEKRLGQPCSFGDNSPDGSVVYDFPIDRKTDYETPDFYCKRCVDPNNESACAQIKI